MEYDWVKIFCIVVLKSVFSWPPYKDDNYLKTKSYCFFLAEVSHEARRRVRENLFFASWEISASRKQWTSEYTNWIVTKLSGLTWLYKTRPGACSDWSKTPFDGFTGVINHAVCWENTRKGCKSRAEGEWFTSFLSVLSTSPVVYHAGKPIESVVYCFYQITMSLPAQ